MIVFNLEYIFEVPMIMFLDKLYILLAVHHCAPKVRSCYAEVPEEIPFTRAAKNQIQLLFLELLEFMR